MSVILTRTVQFGMKVQADAGVEEVLAAADYAGKWYEPRYEYQVENEERMPSGPTHAPAIVAKGPRRLMISVAGELRGGAAGTAPVWSRGLRAAGFSETQLKSVALTSIVGTPQLGEVFGNHASQGSATKTGMVCAIVSGTIYYLPLTGTFATSDACTFYTSSATATVNGTPGNAGYAYRPVTLLDGLSHADLTCEVRNGGQRHTLIDGKCARTTFAVEQGKVPRVAFEFEGLPVMTGDPPGPRTGAVVEDVPAAGAVSAAVKGISFGVGDPPEYVPVAPRSEWRIETAVSPRPTIGDDDIASSGFKAPRITDRRCSISFEPELVKESTRAMVADHFAADTFRAFADVGAASDANGRLILYAPAAQATGNVRTGDRDRIETLPHELLCTDELGGDGTGTDGELMVLWLKA